MRSVKARTVLSVVLGVLAGVGSAAAQLAPSVVRGPYLQSPAPTSIVVRWRTDLPSDSRVRYGAAAGALDRQVTVPGLRTEHEVTLSGLAPDTRTFYAVGASSGDLAGGPDHAFRTPPLAGTRRPVRIWAFGDSGQGTEAQRAVRDAYLAFTGARGTEVWLLLGDNAYLVGSDADYQEKFFPFYAPVLQQVPAWSTFGNHEAFTASSQDETGPYYEIFTFPRAGEAGGIPSGTEAYFSFDYANVHFIGLNSQDPERTPGSAMLEWLERDLAANTQEWTIAFFHHPVYSGGTHDTDTDTGTGPTAPDPDDDFAIQEMRQHVLPILEAGGVDLVLTAHSHNYERSFLLDGHYGTSETLSPEMKLDAGDGRLDGDGPYRKTGEVFDDAHAGTVYVVAGTGSEAFALARRHPAMAATAGVPGSLVLDVDGARLDGSFVAASGEVLDRFTLLRGDGFNFPPVARDDAAATAPLLPVVVDVLANDTDPDDDVLFIEELTQAARGSVTDNGDGTVTYTPASDVAEAVDSFSYTVGDGHGHAATAAVTVTVACPPRADGSFADDLEPAPEPGWTVETAVNASPASAPWHAVADAQAHSPQSSWFSASDAATSDKDDRLISPPLDLSAGSRLSFWHRFHFEAGFDGGVLEITTDGGASWSDLGPWMLEGGYGGTVGIDGAPRPAWTGAGGDGMQRVTVDLGAFAGSGRRLRWRLAADFVTVEETAGWFVDDVEVTSLVSGPGHCNLPPQPGDDTATTTRNRSVAVPVLANDADPNGDPLAVRSLSLPAHGTAAILATGEVLYTPAPGFAGTDRFSYEVTDGELAATGRVTVTVHPSRAPG
jgi:hypothetical protein